MKIVIIGGTGHIGTYLVPRLVETGHQVTVISRSQRQPYLPNAAWKQVEMIIKDREAEESRGAFGKFVLSLEPDAVIDLICFKIDSTRQLVSALKGQVQHFLHCGTMWIYGPSSVVPATEDQPRHPFGEYGIQKAAIETYLLKEARMSGFPATLLHPGHIVGPGWAPVNPAGNLNLNVFSRLARGEEVAIPNLGMETLHHVHADDVAQAFEAALTHRSAAVGESFHVVSPAAITLRGYAEAAAAWFGQTPKLIYLPWEEWRKLNPPEDAAATWDHIAHSPNGSIEKARRLLGYHPRYTSLQAVHEAVQALIAQDKIKV
jgi:nucleoside-diphosphate-sugar epimerase